MAIHLVKKICILSLITLLATGCAIKQQGANTGPDTDAAIEKLIADQKYGKALELLSKQEDKKSNSYTAWKKQLSKLVTTFEKISLSEAGIQAERGEFHAALTTLDRARKKVVASKKLDTLRNELALQRDRKLDEARINLLLVEAQYNLDRLRWYQEEARLKKPSMITSWQMKRVEGALEHLRKNILACISGQKALGNIILASKCLQMALNIQPEKVKKNLTKIEQKELPVELSGSKKTRPEKNAPTTSANPEEGKEVAPAKVETASPETMKQQDLSQKQINQYMKQGSDHYRAGRISEAREIWQKVLELDSEHQAAKEQISRAEKILSRLNTLKKK